MNQITVSEATREDYGKIADLLNDAYSRIGIPLDETIHSIWARTAIALIITARREGELVGTLTIAPPHSPIAIVAEPGEAEISRFAVHPAHQDRGIGNALIVYATDALKRYGRTAVVGQSLNTMNTAHGLYESIGAHRDPTRDIHLPGGSTAYYYRLKL